MKTRIALIAILMAGVALGTAWALEEPFVESHIPFEFMVGNHSLPAGDYTIAQLENDPTAWVIRSKDGKTSVDFLANEAEHASTPTKTVLEFNVLEGKHYLSKIWVQGQRIGRELVPSEAERAMMKPGVKHTKREVEAKHHAAAK